MKKTISAILTLGMLLSITTSAFAANLTTSGFKSDTGPQLAIAPNKTYQFKITSNKKPAITVGNSSIIKIVSNKSTRSPYYFTIKAVGKSGEGAGVYINGTRATVCNIETNTSQIPNPMVSYNTLDEARKAVGFSFAVPANLPSGYQMKDIAVISNNVAEVIYKSGNNRMLYRTAKGSADISGDYTVYEKVNAVAVGGSQVTMKGKGELVQLATWEKDGISFSLYFDEAQTLNSILSIIESIK